MTQQDIDGTQEQPTQDTPSRMPNTKVSDEKRTNLVRLVKDQGSSIKDAASILEIKFNTAKTIINRFDKSGAIAKLPKGGSQKDIMTQAVIDEIEELVSCDPQLTLKEIKQKIENSREDGFSISISTINRCLVQLKITLKKTHLELDRVNSPEKIEERKVYSLWFNNFFSGDFSKAIFVDESSFNLHLKRTMGRSKQGTRANVTVPTIRGRSVSLIASISINGMCHCKTIANSTVNANIFSEYLHELCLYLKDIKRMDNACIILDNARIHKSEDIRRITEQFSFNFHFLSPYSYMLNPIENSFSKLKSCMRARLRTGATGSLSEMIISEIGNITSEDCAGYFRYVSRNITNAAAGLSYNHN